MAPWDYSIGADGGGIVCQYMLISSNEGVSLVLQEELCLTKQASWSYCSSCTSDHDVTK